MPHFNTKYSSQQLKIDCNFLSIELDVFKGAWMEHALKAKNKNATTASISKGSASGAGEKYGCVIILFQYTGCIYFVRSLLYNVRHVSQCGMQL